MFTPYTFLRSDPAIWPAFKTCKYIFELHHARVGKHQCRVILGYKGTGGNNLMVTSGKKGQKGGSDIEADVIASSYLKVPLNFTISSKH